MSDEPPDDYFEAAAGVVEAARELDEARLAYKAADAAADDARRRQTEAEKRLGAAVEKLKSADTGRTGNPA